MAQVSGKHARVEAVMDEAPPKWSLFAKKQSPVKYYVTDLSSTNGTFLNRCQTFAAWSDIHQAVQQFIAGWPHPA